MIRTLLFAFVILLSITSTYATHNMGKDLQYECLGLVNGQMQYRVTVRYYRNCYDNGTAVNAPNTVSLQVLGTPCGFNFNTNLPLDASAMPANGTEVSELCPSQLPQSGCNWVQGQPPPLYPGVQVYTYTGIVNVPPACTQVTFGTTDCCRNGAVDNIPNAGGADLSIFATANNGLDPLTGQSYCNKSVSFTTAPVPFFCLGSNVTFNHGAVDQDGDSLVYSLINPLQGFGLPYTNINFSAGWSVNNPIRTNPTNSFQFDRATGQMAFTPGFIEQDVLAMRVDEYRNGVLIGSTMRDIQVVILNCAISIPAQEPITNVQNGNQVDSLSVQVCPGTPLRFDILCTDGANHDLTLTSNINTTPSAIPGATMTQIGTGDTVTARINWTPLPADTGCHDFIIIAKNDDCPINGSYTRVYTICVFTKVQLLTASTTFCGTPVQLTATGGTNFTWTPSAGPNGVSNPTIYNPTVSPVADTKYYFTSDCGVDSVLVRSAPPFTYDAGPGGSICQNGLVNLNATTDNLYAPYQFQWVPSTGLNDPISNLPNDTVPNPAASPLVTTKYLLYVTGTNGCTNVDSLTINVTGSGPNIVAKAVPNNVCPKDPVQLNIVTNPQSCGITQTPCSGSRVTSTVGTGTGVFPTGSPTTYPTIYGHYSNSARHQFLYLQSELIALVGSGGSIDSISFNMVTVNNLLDTMKNFEIKMACTQVGSLTSWQPNLTTVFSPKNVALGNTSGWVTHKLDFPYDWDGTSNLVIDICFNNPPVSPPTLNRKMVCTPTAFNSVYYSNGNTAQCGNTGTPLAKVNRPNTRFGLCVIDVTGLPIAWTPAVGVNAPNPTNIANPIARPETPVIYAVDVTATNGCHSKDFVYVNVDTSFRFNAFPNDTFFCSTNTTLTLTTITQASPMPPASSYTWTNLATNTVVGTGTSITVSPTVSTNYLVRLIGPACTLTDTVRVVLGSSIPLTLVVDSIKCNGQANGKIKGVPSGGIPPLTYIWSSNPSIVDSIQNLGAGTYSVTINDSQGCSGNASTTLTQPTLVTASATRQNITCNGANNGSVTVTTIGGTPGYSYSWTPAQSNTGNLTGLGAGTYTTIVTDAFGCTATATSTVSQPTVLVISTSSSPAISFGGSEGSAYVIASGGTAPYVYTWSNSSNNDSISNLPAATYYVTVCDANNCCKFDSAVVTDPPPIILTFVNTQNACFGDCNGTSRISAVGGIEPYIFTWSTGVTDSVINNLCFGTYRVTVTDSAGISVTGSINISQPTAVTVLLDTTAITCFGANNGQALAIGSGGTGLITYNWSLGGNTNPITNLAPGTYNVTATDANSCTATASWTAIEPALLVVSITSTTNVSCFGGNDGTALASATGGVLPYTYAWSNNVFTTTSSNGFNAGNQSVAVTDANGCTATTNFVITEPTELTATILYITNVSCNAGTDGAAEIVAAGGTPNYTYLWTNGTATPAIAGLAVGNYNVTVTDANSCSTIVAITITQPSAIVLNFAHTDPLCTGDNNGTATVTATGGTPSYTYDWGTSDIGNFTSSLSSIVAGTYSVTVYDAIQCSVTGSEIVSNPPSLNAELVNIKQISCSNAADGSVEANVTGGTPPINFAWSDGQTTAVASNLAPNTYYVLVTDNNGCDTTLNITFTAPPAIAINLLFIDSVSCPAYTDGAIQVSAIGGTPGATIPYQYSIDGITYQTSEFFQALPAGVYPVYIRDGQGCTKDTTVTIGEPVKPNLGILPQDSTMQLGESITLVSELSNYSGSEVNFYSWSPISGLNCSDCMNVIALPYANTEYFLTVNYLGNCSVSQSVLVYVGDGDEFFIPTGFSPNGDGNNDRFEVYGTGLAKVNVKIFNRWGEKIFDSANQWLGWDGSYKGVVQNPGVYSYLIEGTYLNGKVKQRTGTVTILR